MEPTVSSETSAIRTQTPGNYPKRNKLHLEHGESLKTRRKKSLVLCRETNPGLSVGILSLPRRSDAKYWCNVWWTLNKCLQLLLWSAWRRRHFFAPKHRRMSNRTMSQNMPNFIPYQRQALHVASALQTRVDDLYPNSIFCVLRVVRDPRINVYPARRIQSFLNLRASDAVSRVLYWLKLNVKLSSETAVNFGCFRVVA